MTEHGKGDNTIGSAAFMNKSRKPGPELSVYLARITDPHDVFRAGPPHQQLVSLPGGVARVICLGVRHDPQPDDYGHCLIVGLTSEWQCDRLAEAS